VSADEEHRDDDLGVAHAPGELLGARQSGLFGSRDAPSPEGSDLASPSIAALRDAVLQIDSAIDMGIAGDDLEYFVRDVCARCFPHRSAVFVLDDAPERPGLSRAAAELYGVSDAMFDESGIELVDRYEPRYGASVAGFDVPIQSEGKLLGVFGLEYPVVPDDVTTDREALSLVAFATGSALSRARASDESRRLLDQIRHAQKLATIGQLAASITHELNHPLTTISVYADLLLRRAEDAGRDEWETVRLSRIAAAAARMHSFTRDLINYSRPSQKERAYEDLRALIDRSLSICEPVIARTGATVTVDADEDVGAIFCIGSQIEQVLVNLVTNAAHAVNPDQGTIRIAVGKAAPNIRIVVEDDGPGVPEQHRHAVFDAFFSTKAPGSGTGLGLSIVHRIVEEHGGSIHVGDSSLGGAAFEILLPAIRV
jgi:signal transduction histidine kinase